MKTKQIEKLRLIRNNFTGLLGYTPYPDTDDLSMNEIAVKLDQVIDVVNLLLEQNK